MRDQLTAFFANRFATERPGARRIGIEYEFPLVNRDGEAISYEIVEGLLLHLGEHGWELIRDPKTNAVVAVEHQVDPAQCVPAARDRIELELGHCTLELALAPETNLFDAEVRLQQMIGRIVPYLRRRGCRLLGYGIQPQTSPRRDLVSPKGKYGVYQRTSPNRMVPVTDGNDIHLFTLTASCHCHIDIEIAEAVRAVNVLNGLVGLQMALCVNSPIWKGRVDPQWKAAREMFYDLGMTNWRGRIGNPNRFADLSDYVTRLCSYPTILVKRDNEYLSLPHYATAFDYFEAADGARAERDDGTAVVVKPTLSDLLVFAGLWWHTARLSPTYGTLEARGFCQQPPGEAMVAPALALGIVEQIDAAEELLERAPWQAWVQLREDVARQGLDAHFAGKPVAPLAGTLLAMAKAGLRKRGLGEESLLAPLGRRLDAHRTPADDAIEVFSRSGMDGLIDTLAFY